MLGNGFDVNFGFSGMVKLGRELRGRRGRGAWARRFAAPESFRHAMRRLDACLQREYTAADATRPVYAAFLDEATDLLPNPALREASAHFRASAAMWSRISARARRAAADGPPDSAGLSRLLDEFADLVESAASIEREAVARLASLA